MVSRAAAAQTAPSCLLPENRLARHRQKRFHAGPWLRLACLFGKPPGQISPTPVPRRYGLLHLTLRLPGGTAQADVKMVVVPPPGAEFVQPWRTGELLTQRSLDRRINKNALHR